MSASDARTPAPGRTLVPGGGAGAVLVVAGPTASGKERLALELARRLGGEIVSMDSMKVYRELEIATAKPSAAQQAETPHHLVGFVDPHLEFSTGQWLEGARAAVDDIHARGRVAILSGGTSLYLKAFLEGLSEGPEADWDLRRRLIDEGRQSGLERLHNRLSSLDPAAAARIHPSDERRIVRALEICEKTGRPASEVRRWGGQERERPPYPVRVFGIEWARADLYARIDRRVERMVERGLFEEALRARQREPAVSRTAWQSIGYKEIAGGQQSGLSRQETIARIQQATRRFAKGQLTWLRKFEIDWIAVAAGEASAEPDVEAWADEVERRLSRRPPIS